MKKREDLDYTLLPDELWSKIFIQALDLHDLMNYKWTRKFLHGSQNCGLTQIEQTCKHFRHIVVQDCLWRDACLKHCKRLEDVIQDGDTQELWNGRSQYPSQKHGSAEEEVQKRKSLLFKRLYGLLIAKDYRGRLINEILWTSNLSDGYDPSEDYDQYLEEKWHATKNHLIGYQPKKDQIGGQLDEAVTRILVHLHYPMAIVRNLEMEILGHKHKAVHVRLYRSLPNRSGQAVDLNLPPADCQENFVNLNKYVQDFFSSPREVVCDKILKRGLTFIEIERFLCNDGALMIELYVKDEDLASEETPKMEIVTMNIRGSIVPGMKISDKGVLSSIAYDDLKVEAYGGLRNGGSM